MYKVSMEGDVYSKKYNDFYRSRSGAYEESKYVFCRGTGFPEIALGLKEISVAETGFGLGLNFAALIESLYTYTKDSLILNYTAIEEFVLPRKILEQAWSPVLLPIKQEFLPLWPECFSSSPMIYGCELNANDGSFYISFAIRNISVRLCIFALPLSKAVHFFKPNPKPKFWFLDGFAPAKNPDMWGEDLYKMIEKNISKGAVFSTFTAAGSVKRGMEGIGFEVMRVKGFGNKKHMMKGFFL